MSMYPPVYNAQHHTPGDYKGTVKYEDFDSEEAAYAAVEAAGAGSVTKFAVYDNLPGALPEKRHSSIWLKVYENGQWRNINIF